MLIFWISTMFLLLLSSSYFRHSLFSWYLYNNKNKLTIKSNMLLTCGLLLLIPADFINGGPLFELCLHWFYHYGSIFICQQIQPLSVATSVPLSVTLRSLDRVFSLAVGTKLSDLFPWDRRSLLHPWLNAYSLSIQLSWASLDPFAVRARTSLASCSKPLSYL